jgi:hypothetical protein
MSMADDVAIIRNLDAYVRNTIRDELKKLGVPCFCFYGTVSAVRTANGKTYADVMLNGSSTASTNIPVNPDIAANVTAGTPVIVMAMNFNTKDLYVMARKLA